MRTSNSVHRSRRFKICADAQVHLRIPTPEGDMLDLRILDCSITGISVVISQVSATPELHLSTLTQTGAILHEVQVSTPRGSVALGKVMVCNVRPGTDESTTVGILAIDRRVPVAEILSHYLADPLHERRSPFEFEGDLVHSTTAMFNEKKSESNDIFAKCSDFGVFFRDWSRSSRYRYSTPRRASEHHKRTSFGSYENMLIMGSNDYLGLASHPKVILAAQDALKKYGFGSTGSPLTTGLTDLHVALCDRLAKMLGKEKVILFNSGYAANVGSLPALLRASDMCVIDRLAQASLHDGLSMSRSQNYVFKHNNVQDLERILSLQRAGSNGALTVTEGVFSMDGDIADLSNIIAVSKKYNARIFVDEAHSFGVLGENGLGAAEACGVLPHVDVIMGTFSKICGAIGGFVASSRDVCDWLYWYARSQMFSVSLPPSTIAAVYAALEVFTEEKERTASLHRNIDVFSRGIRQLGFKLPENHVGPIVPVVIGDEGLMSDINEHLMKMGILVTPIVYPAVSRGSCRFRFTVTSELTLDEIAYVLTCLSDAIKGVGFDPAVSSNNLT